MRKANKKSLLLWSLIFIPYLLLIPAAFWYFNTLNSIEHSTFVVINKAEMALYHYNYRGVLLQKAQIATGKNSGNKRLKGDNRTPEGVFNIVVVEDASTWTHDFKGDSLGPISGAYGPYFIRLNVPGQKGIGIHGTHDNRSIGTRASEGCIRLRNDDLLQLVKSLKTASVVVITPGIEDLRTGMFDTLTKVVTKPIENKKKDKAVYPIKKNNENSIKQSVKK